MNGSESLDTKCMNRMHYDDVKEVANSLRAVVPGKKGDGCSRFINPNTGMLIEFDLTGTYQHGAKFVWFRPAVSSCCF